MADGSRMAPRKAWLARGSRGAWDCTPAARVTVGAGDRVHTLTITGIVSTGGREDNAILAPLQVAQDLAGRPGQYRRLLVSALTKPADAFSERDPATMTPVEYDRWYCSPYISSISHQMQQELPGVEVRAIRQVAEGEGRILTRVGGLMWLVTIAALFAAALAVGATSATTVLERRSEIGLMKALGASHRAVGAFFLAEQLLLALVGGVAGYAIGLGAGASSRDWNFWHCSRPSMDSFPDRADPGGGGGACWAASCRSDAHRASIPLPYCGESEDVATRSMFLRILWKLLGASRGRLALALVALSSGAAVCSALSECKSGCGTETDAGIPHARRERRRRAAIGAAATPRWRMPPSWIASPGCTFRRLSPQRLICTLPQTPERSL